MIRSQIELTVFATKYKKAVSLIGQALMDYLDIDDLDELEAKCRIELSHKAVPATSPNDFDSIAGFEVTAVVVFRNV
jgi:hypothetical protein